MGDFILELNEELIISEYDLIKNEYNKINEDNTHYSKQEDFELFLDNIDKKK